MLNIVVPMAGAGSRFAKAGFLDPKPLIPVQGTPMIRLVIENLRPKSEHKFIFICQREHVEKYGLSERLALWAPGSAVVQIDHLTEGAACTVLTAAHLIDNSAPLMIANSDQWVDTDITDYVGRLESGGSDGLIMTMTADDPKWSYVALDDENNVTRVVEKEVISNEATVGIYNFARGMDFVDAAKQMIELNDRSNNEFYVAPVYNYLICAGAKVGIYNVGSEGGGMYGLGIPEDLEAFIKLPACDRALTGLLL